MSEAFPGGSKNLPAMQETQVQFLGQEDLLEKEMATHSSILELPWWLGGKESACQCRRPGFNPRVGKISWRKKWQPTPVFLPGKSCGQRSLVGYSPWAGKELDTTEWLNHHPECIHMHYYKNNKWLIGSTYIHIWSNKYTVCPINKLCVLTQSIVGWICAYGITDI